MKQLKCSKCNKTQSQGKFCLDCGQELKEVITENVQFKPIDTTRSSEQLKRDVRKWLNRIGVQNPDIQIGTGDFDAEVTYILRNSKYSFKSTLQRNVTNNLAAIEQFLHHRVISIERGIESIEQAFAGYEAIPDLRNVQNPFEVLGFQTKVDVEVARSKFKQLARKFHPDVNDSPEATAQFQRMKKAMDEIEGHK